MANPMAAIAAMTGQQASSGAQNIGQYVTAAMLAAAGSNCTCETCRLMAKAAKLMRTNLLEEENDAGS